MRALLILATLADLALGALFVAVSGFVLQGVNNTGPDSALTAILYVCFVLLCFAAPALAWAIRARAAPALVQAIAWSPPGIGAAALLLEPLFV